MFIVKYSYDQFIDFLSTDRGEIERIVNYIKSRPEIETVLGKYGFDKDVKKIFCEKHLHIDKLYH